MVVQNASCSPGAAVIQCEHAPNYNGNNFYSDDCNDEWIFVPVREIVTKLTAAIWQDQSYLNKYSRAGYTREVNQTFADATKPFYKKYGVEYIPSYFNFTSKADACSTPYGPCSSSTCGSTCSDRKAAPNHHTNAPYNKFNLFSSGNGSFYIAFGLTVKELCWNNANAGPHEDIGGVWHPHDSNGFINQNYWIHMRNVRVMQHEITHEYGPLNHTSSPNDPCIMGDGYNKNFQYNLDTIWCVKCWMRMIQEI